MSATTSARWSLREGGGSAAEKFFATGGSGAWSSFNPSAPTVRTTFWRGRWKARGIPWIAAATRWCGMFSFNSSCSASTSPAFAPPEPSYTVHSVSFSILPQPPILGSFISAVSSRSQR